MKTIYSFLLIFFLIIFHQTMVYAEVMPVTHTLTHNTNPAELEYAKDLFKQQLRKKTVTKDDWDALTHFLKSANEASPALFKERAPNVFAIFEAIAGNTAAPLDLVNMADKLTRKALNTFQFASRAHEFAHLLAKVQSMNPPVFGMLTSRI